MGKKLDLAGQRFGRLVVLEEAGRGKSGHVLWRCRCDCGGETVVFTHHLRNCATASCGCFRREHAAEVERDVNTKHGLRSHPLYGVWHSMLQRCGTIKGASERVHRDYVERGIMVCEEWKTFQNFYDWSMSHGYASGLQIDRIDNNRGYVPDNCRFVTPKQNTNNRRCTIRLSDGTSLADFCSEIGIITCENGYQSRMYHRVRNAYTRSNKIHPDLFTALEKDIAKQERLLAQAVAIREEWETKIALLKEQLKSASLAI